MTAVGIAIMPVAAEKYAEDEMDNPDVNIWCDQTIKPIIEIDKIAAIQENGENKVEPQIEQHNFEIIPNIGIKII